MNSRQIQRILFAGIGVGWLIFLALTAGCGHLAQYERTYSVSYEGASAKVTLKPLPQNRDIPPQYQRP